MVYRHGYLVGDAVIQPIHTKTLDGKPVYRRKGMPAGVWLPLPAPIDLLIDYLKQHLDIRHTTVLVSYLGIQEASISRTRKGTHGLPLHWLVKMSDFSGLSLEELRAISGLPLSVEPHKRARKSQDIVDDSNRHLGLADPT